MQTIINCPVCGGFLSSPFLSCIDYTITQKPFSLVKCNSCELILTNPRPEENELVNYYKSNTYISHSKKANGFFDSLYFLIRRFALKGKLKKISQYSEKGKILDYGCGTAEFLKTCKKADWKIAGIEPSDEANKIARTNTGITIHKSIDELKDNDFNIITLWHVLEHIPDLTDALKNISTKLNQNGIIFIAVPNHKSYDCQHYEKFWAGYDVPRHLWHFSEKNMRILLNSCSLSLIAILPMKLDSYYVSLLSEKYKAGRITLIGLFKSLFIGFLSNRKARITGNYSSLIYIAKK